MKVAIMQPTFAPWLGYFDLIAEVDRFVFLDDAQVIFKSWHHRNQLFMPNGQVGWIRAPLKKKGNYGAAIKDMPLDLGSREWAKLGSTLKHVYQKAPAYDELAPVVEVWMSAKSANLAELNTRLIMEVSHRMGFQPEWIFSSALGCPGHRSGKLLAILKLLGATTYCSARGSFGYMKEDGLFPVSDLEVLFQDFQHPAYRQFHSTQFVSHLSILDALFNLGFEGTGRLIQNAGGAWQNWQEREKADKD
ncbi:MAG: WbqC family protein [Deltaproteobacteria bacterium]|nr:WbqC family protein [Deltaproteobacteria bacterium]